MLQRLQETSRDHIVKLGEIWNQIVKSKLAELPSKMVQCLLSCSYIEFVTVFLCNTPSAIVFQSRFHKSSIRPDIQMTCYTCITELPRMWSPLNETAKKEVTTQLRDVEVPALIDLAPDTGAYVSEVDPTEQTILTGPMAPLLGFPLALITSKDWILHHTSSKSNRCLQSMQRLACQPSQSSQRYLDVICIMTSVRERVSNFDHYL